MSALLQRLRRPGPLVVTSLAYFLVASGLMIWRGISVSPDYIFLLLVPVGLVSGRFLGYLRDWVPFVTIFLGWEAMRGIAPQLGIPPHVADLAASEKAVFFGHLPTVIVQSWVTGSARTDLAVVCTLVYFCHFIFPLAVGMVLWLVDRTQFLRFTVALMGMSFVAFVFFLLVPTAPPWYAEQHGVISGAHHLLSHALPSSISPYYQSLNANPVAAFPSLHSAFPFLGFLALRRVYPRASWLALAWCLLVWFSVIFLGEHYGVDVLSGIATAGAAWWTMVQVVAPRVGVLQARTADAAESIQPTPLAA